MTNWIKLPLETNHKTRDAGAAAECAELTVAVDMIIDAVENLDKRLIDALK